MTKKKPFCVRGHDLAEAGQDAARRCLECRREDAEVREREYAAEVAERDAERVRLREQTERRREQEYRAAIRAGGDVAATARWWRLYDQTIDATESRLGLCQWATDSGQPGACTRRTADVYCYVHNRQLEREQTRKEGAEHETATR
jgi:hypothetical protein